MIEQLNHKNPQDQDNYNAIWNCKNPNQQQKRFPTVLCVCSAGLLRSPSIAHILANKGYNTRSAGVYDYALIRVSEVLLTWAKYVVCASQEHADWIKDNYPDYADGIVVLNIPDKYFYRTSILMDLIEQKLKEANFE